MEFQIRSYIKTGVAQDSFVDVANYDGELPDRGYIKGAIFWSIGNTTILTEANWDIVDLLWSFLLDGILKLTESESFETYFPSQPLLLRLSRAGEYAVKITIGDFTTVVEKPVMVQSLISGGRHFFNSMLKIAPDLKNKWDNNINKIKLIERIYI